MNCLCWAVVHLQGYRGWNVFYPMPRLVGSDFCITTQTCQTCKDARLPGSKNRRSSPSVLLRYNSKTVLIDCGRTFKEAITVAITRHNVTAIDAIVLSHGHCDAILGCGLSCGADLIRLDDLRELSGGSPIPVFLDQDITVLDRI